MITVLFDRYHTVHRARLALARLQGEAAGPLGPGQEAAQAAAP